MSKITAAIRLNIRSIFLSALYISGIFALPCQASGQKEPDKAAISSATREVDRPVREKIEKDLFSRKPVDTPAEDAVNITSETQNINEKR